MKQFRTMLLGSAAMSMAAMVAMPAEAAEVEKSLTMSGWVNKAAAFVDDGDSTYTDFIEPGHGRSRVRWIGEAKGPNFTMGGVIELGLTINDSNGQNQVTDENTGSDTGTLQGRRAAVYITHKKFGTINLGKYQAASDGHVEADLSGTTVSSKNGEYVGLEGTTYRFLPDGTDMGSAGNNTFPANAIDISTVVDQLDNLQTGGRPNGVRYTSPSFKGASLRFGTYEGGSTDVAVHYYAKLKLPKIGDTKIAARVAAYNTSGNSTISDGGIGGSISALHNSGISLTFAGAERDETREAVNGDDPTNLWLRVGYQFKSLAYGKTHLSANWQQTDNLTSNLGTSNQDVDVWGANIVQHFDAYGTELYGGFAVFDLEAGNAIRYEDIDVGWVGMRVKF